MLPRTLEPEVMDDTQEVDEYRNMDHTEVNQRFVSDLSAAGEVGPRVIDIGCGTAAIPVLLCQSREDVQVMGVDSSATMLDVARDEIELGGVVGRIQLEQADCKNLEGFESEMADTVISNTVLHHIAEPTLVLSEALRLLAPGGRIFIRDLLRPESADEVESIVNDHAANESEFARQLLRQSLHAALTVSEARGILGGLGVDPDAVNQTSDRHWTLDWTSPEAGDA